MRWDESVGREADGARPVRSRVVAIGGVDVRIDGALVSVDGGPVETLPSRERELLEVLLERPGTVLSKSELLRRVWDTADADEHVVEVTMARLRARLGDAAGGIETVVRRGYRVDVA